MPKSVTSLAEVEENIRVYQASLPGHPDLAARIRQHPAWYAVRDENGRWLFGPSKFIGYRHADPRSYLKSYDRRDGKETEPSLAQWFDRVPDGTALAGELRAAFEQFAGAYGKTANARWRVSVPTAIATALGQRHRPTEFSQRIAFDARICGGRPHIRGTRIRVSDIVGAFAAGETADQLLAEFPYLTGKDIQAALHYAATSVDHLVVVAA